MTGPSSPVFISRGASHKSSALFSADPGAYWASLRHLPVVAFDGSERRYYITRRDDVLAALHDPAKFQSPEHVFPTTVRGEPLRMLPSSCGPEEHERFAAVLRPLFSPRALAQFEPAVRAAAVAAVAAVAPLGSCDATTTAAIEEFPYEGLLAVCGLPPDGQHVAHLTGQAIVNDELPLLAYILTAAHESASQLQRGPGILWRLFDGLESEDFPLTEADVLGVLLSIFGGTEAIGISICFALLHPASDRKLRVALRDAPNHIPAFVDEVLRLASPAVIVLRFTSEEVVIGGVSIPAGAGVWLCLGAAGREDGGDEIAMSSDGRAETAALGPRRRHPSLHGGGAGANDDERLRQRVASPDTRLRAGAGFRSVAHPPAAAGGHN